MAKQQRINAGVIAVLSAANLTGNTWFGVMDGMLMGIVFCWRRFSW